MVDTSQRCREPIFCSTPVRSVGHEQSWGSLQQHDDRDLVYTKHLDKIPEVGMLALAADGFDGPRQTHQSNPLASNVPGAGGERSYKGTTEGCDIRYLERETST